MTIFYKYPINSKRKSDNWIIEDKSCCRADPKRAIVKTESVKETRKRIKDILFINVFYREAVILQLNDEPTYTVFFGDQNSSLFDGIFLILLRVQ